MKVSQLRALIKESIAQQLQGAKNTTAKGKIDQADALIKIYTDQVKAYTKLADEADKLLKKDPFPEMQKEVDTLRAKVQQKQDKLVQVETHKKSLESQLKTAPKAPKKEEKKN